MGERHTGAVMGRDGSIAFRLWAPTSETVEIVLDGGGAFPLTAEPGGWFRGGGDNVRAGTRYRVRLDGAETYPDPWSRYQPGGVHGPSEVVDLEAYEWQDGSWRGVRAADLVIYEVHVGTATPTGTFDALRERLPYLVELGVTAVELMPVVEFPGARNWGYDGVYLFAPSSVYGGPRALQRFVDAAHGHGLAVILDVVYNHFGPEGNYLPAVTGGRIFTEKHHTPWGAAINYDDAGSDAVRHTVLENVRQWIRDYHIDGLRLDAAHAIVDDTRPHILAEIVVAAREVAGDRQVVVIAEDERNERRLLLPASQGGYQLDAVWADDAHHVIRRLTAGDRDGYYAAYEGTTRELAETLRRGWLYEGAYYEPTDEKRGTPAQGLPPQAFVHCIQNHDQVGNRALGERLHHEIGLDVYRAVSALLLLSPYTPLLWMGQEWAATSPFLYFTDHPEELGRLVTEGRRAEFRRFERFSDPAVRERIPDPQAEDTFLRSRPDWDEATRAPHAGVLALYRDLLALRRTHPALQQRQRDMWDVADVGDAGVSLRRRAPDGPSLLLVAALNGELEVSLEGDATAAPDGSVWRILLDTEAEPYGGGGTAGALEQAAGGTGNDPAGHLLRLAGPAAVLLESAHHA